MSPEFINEFFFLTGVSVTLKNPPYKDGGFLVAYNVYDRPKTLSGVRLSFFLSAVRGSYL